jgi:NNP family nitrate/nitrite transporter-like MFS transporter
MTRGLRHNLPTVLMLVLIMFFLFIARIIYSPLLLSIERSLSLNHAGAASFFLFITLGYGLMMLFSGYVAARLQHRWVIVLAVLLSCLGLVVISVSPSLVTIRLGLILLGTGPGLYFPSGVPTITSLVETRDEGKAIAMHEVGPNSAFVLAPILAALLLPLFSWRAILLFVAAFGVLAGLVFAVFARGGRFHGQPPHLENARTILPRPSFWIMTSLFALGAGASIGVFALTPTYLVAERGLEASTVNSLVGLSRLSSLGAVFLAGYLADRLGVQKTMAGVVLLTGAATAALTAGGRPLLLAAVFLQPILSASFFPVAFTAIGRIAPRRVHNLTIAFLFPLAYSFGSGVMPYVFGVLGDRVSFAAGFLVYGLVLVAASVLPFLLRLESVTAGYPT